MLRKRRRGREEENRYVILSCRHTLEDQNLIRPAVLVQIYATSEERKQRNRQAQAAFRERRTEYIKQLETTIKRNEDSLQSLQQSHRSAADECLMLRYKNSLLERILLEKGKRALVVTAQSIADENGVQASMYKRSYG
jgi:hypothetical protein